MIVSKLLHHNLQLFYCTIFQSRLRKFFNNLIWLNLGKIKPTTAFMTGKLKIAGNMGKAMALEKMMAKMQKGRSYHTSTNNNCKFLCYALLQFVYFTIFSFQSSLNI